MMDEDSFKFDIKVEVELKDGRLNTRVCASEEDLPEVAYQVQLAYIMVISSAIASRKPFGKGEVDIKEVEE
jgi:hypothetical protein